MGIVKGCGKIILEETILEKAAISAIQEFVDVFVGKACESVVFLKAVNYLHVGVVVP